MRVYDGCEWWDLTELKARAEKAEAELSESVNREKNLQLEVERAFCAGWHRGLCAKDGDSDRKAYQEWKAQKEGNRE